MNNTITNTIYKWAPWLITVVAFYSCAQIINPGGGPKDIQPPRAIKYIPDSATKNFNTKRITVLFNEYIELSDLQKQLVISPPMGRAPEISSKGKMLSIILKDSLRKNTTYCFNFGNAIRDNKEANAMANFKYIFSTGNHLDTLSLRGTVKNNVDQKTEKGILVMLYEATMSDSAPYKTMPSYFAKTNEGGEYKIYNIRPGAYKAFSLQDANADYLYNLPAETIAFSDTLVNILRNTTLDFSLFQESAKQQKLLKTYLPEPGHITFVFAKPLADSLRFRFLSQQPKQNLIYEYSINKDTLHYWFADDLKDSLKIEIAEGKKILETVKIRLLTKEILLNSIRGEKPSLKVATNLYKDKPFDFNKKIELKFNHPIKNFKPNELYLTSGSKRINPANTNFTDNLNRNFSFQYPLLQDSAYQLFIPPGAFTDIFGFSNDTLKISFKTQQEQLYGSFRLNLKIKNSTKHILHFINATGEIIKELNSENSIYKYSHLLPGEYKLRMIYDRNGDDKWTTGDYLEKQKPETIMYYPGVITIRSNWDLELDWSP